MEEGGSKRKRLLDQQVEELKRTFNGESSPIKDISLEDNDDMPSISFNLKGMSLSLLLPEEFPRGEYLLNFSDGDVKMYSAPQQRDKKKKKQKKQKKKEEKESKETKEEQPCALVLVIQKIIDDNSGTKGGRKKRRLADSLDDSAGGSEEDLNLSSSSGLKGSDLGDELEDAEEKERFKELQAKAEEAEHAYRGVASVLVEKSQWDAAVKVFFEASMFVATRQEAEVLGVAYDKYIVVEFTFSAPYYLAGTKIPGVRLYQSESKTRSIPEAFGLQWQIEKRLTDFLQSGGDLSKMRKTDAPRKLDAYVERMRSSGGGRNNNNNNKDNDDAVKVSHDAAHQLVGMGFDIPMVFAALRHEKNNIERAMELLLQGDRLPKILQEQLKQGLPLDFEETSTMKDDKGKQHAQNEDEAALTALGVEMGFDASTVKECIEELQEALSMKLTMEDVPLLLDRLTTFRPSFKLSDIENKNAIVRALRYVEWCFKTCTSRCVICDCDLEFEGLKPTVCSSSLCIYSYESYGLGVDVAAEVRMHPEVVDLMISVTVAGANGARRDDFFAPYPFGVEVKQRDGELYSFTTSSQPPGKDWSKLCSVLDMLPSVSDMRDMAMDNKALKKGLDNIHPLLYPLLRWILTSNRCHLRKLESKHQISTLQTPHQFILLSAPVAKERRFQELKKQHGSFWAFHGSPIANWHSIMRAGLQNLSGSNKQLHGAVNGSGIYLAPNSGLSMGYMGWGKGWSKSILGESSQLGMMALCEVINYQDRKNKHGHHYMGNYVVEQEDHVTTRFFLIWTQGGGGRGDFYERPAQFVDVKANELHIPATALLHM